MSGDRIVVGARLADDGVRHDVGAVYLYGLQAGSWVETKLTAANGASHDFYGATVAVSGDRVATGARGDDGQGVDSGAASVFEPDRPTCNGLRVTVDLGQGQKPTPGPDVILGTAEGEQIAALGGDDTICALGGDDRILAGVGNDIVRGGAGSDRIRGGPGSDHMVGGADRDVLAANAGDDILRGSAGPDRLNGGIGVDRLIGGEGDGQLRGFPGDDSLVGGPGFDRLWGGGDVDSCAGEVEVACEN